MTHNNRVLQFERLAGILAPARTGGRPEPAPGPSPGCDQSGPDPEPAGGSERPAESVADVSSGGRRQAGAATESRGRSSGGRNRDWQAWQAERLGLEVQARLFAFGGVCQFICTGCMKFLKNAASVLANQGQLQHTEFRGRSRRPKSRCNGNRESETILNRS